MEELSNMLNRLLHRGDEEEIRQDELKKQIDAIYRIYAGTVGPEQLIINAGKYDALKYIHDENPGKRLLGLQGLSYSPIAGRYAGSDGQAGKPAV